MARKTAAKTTDAKTTEPVGTQFTASRPGPKPDKNREPQDNELGRLHRTDTSTDINAEEPGTDTVYGIASRARWGSEEVHQLNQDAAQVEQLVKTEE